MLQIRIHGRGGQGVVTAAELLSIAAFEQGRHAQAFPSFGSERTGGEERPMLGRRVVVYGGGNTAIDRQLAVTRLLDGRQPLDQHPFLQGLFDFEVECRHPFAGAAVDD
jgi:hypothetical protein